MPFVTGFQSGRSISGPDVDAAIKHHNQNFLRATVVVEDWQVDAGEIMQKPLFILTRESRMRLLRGLMMGLGQECRDGLALALH